MQNTFKEGKEKKRKEGINETKKRKQRRVTTLSVTRARATGPLQGIQSKEPETTDKIKIIKVLIDAYVFVQIT